MARLYVTDLDKTYLLSSGKAPDPQPWNELQDQGVLLTFATSRGARRAMGLLPQHNLRCRFVAYNGAVIWDPHAKPGPVLINALSRPQLGKVLRLAEREGLPTPFILGFDTTGAERCLYEEIQNAGMQFFLNQRKGKPGAPEQVLHIAESSKILEHIIVMTFIADETSTYQLQAAARGLGLGTKRYPDPYAEPGTWALEVLNPRADKGTALLQLCEYYRLDPKDMTCFGDSLNDMDMFSVSGTSLAVANALPEVKDMASTTLLWTNDEQAVTRYIRAQGGRP